MNAQRVWQELCQGYNEQDWKTVKQRAEDLIGWLQQEGKPPRITRELANAFSNKVIALAVCRKMLREANRRTKEV